MWSMKKSKCIYKELDRLKKNLVLLYKLDIFFIIGKRTYW